ncbi:MAG: flagellar brake protein [Rectinemataceae bacterium]
MILLVLLGVLILVLFAVAFTLSTRGAKRYSWIEYYLKAREVGLSFREAGTLREAAAFANVTDPTNILWSPRDMDKAIAALLARLAAEGKDRSREGVSFVDRVYALRKKLEFEQPRHKYGIRSSRHMAQGQRVRVLLHGVGVFNSTIIDNHQRYLVLSYPAGGRLPKGWVWKGKKVSIYFWRHEDAGYVFDSYVIDDLRIRSVPVLQVSHSEALLRTQKRKSIRVHSSIPAYLYLLKRIEGAYEKPERAPGLRCLVQDVSEDGASAAIGGKALPGLHVKLQFALGERTIVMSGTVRSVDYDSERNRSVLHIAAVTPSPRTRNAIRSYVYNIRATNEDRSEGTGDRVDGTSVRASFP